MKFLLVCEDALYVVWPNGNRMVLPATRRFYHRAIARTHGCAVIIREKKNG